MVLCNLNIFLIYFVCILCFSISVEAEEFYPGSQSNQESSEKLQRLAKFVEDAYRRSSETFQNNENSEISPKANAIPDFTYSLPIKSDVGNSGSTFAVGPSDPRYYKQDDLVERHEDSVQHVDNIEQIDDNQILTSNKYQQRSMSSGGSFSDDMVARGARRLDDDSSGIYLVAMVAGISAAATVGLVAFGVGWYTLQKKTKAAADVEYPAYGVTGPHKEISPSATAGDRRLAQSAQMYHYQHQKQQIIAMENRAGGGQGNGSLSEAESDDENDEGDYTVYECPGLAPTGEMEVKNPLFLDDPTPATPAAAITSTVNIVAQQDNNTGKQ